MRTPTWPSLPENLSFDEFDDEDQILDFINSLEVNAKRIFLDALDKSRGEDIILYTRTAIPAVHVVLMKFTEKGDEGLVLLLSRSEELIYSHFERLKEQTPSHIKYLDKALNIIHTQIKNAEEILNQNKQKDNETREI